MPDLSHSLQGRDLGYLRIVADLWGIELTAPDARTALPLLAAALLDKELIREVVEALPEGAQAALAGLQQEGGRIPYALFTRRYGAVREMGPARRDRERPYLDPETPAEVLWYRALIARAFFDAPGEPQEFAYIPDDLLARLPALRGAAPPPFGRPASPLESAIPILAGDRILDHACTLLAALRSGRPVPDFASSGWTQLGPALVGLLAAAGLLDARRIPLPEPTRAFLEAPRGEALAALARAWASSPEFNELRLLPDLAFEGEWSNDPLRARRFVIEAVTGLPEGAWWSLSALVAAVRERHPDFQRPAGDYDSWYIRSAAGGEFLRGFAHWEDVDGALIRFTISGPLHWLGIVDLAAAEADAAPAAFRLSRWGAGLLNGRAPEGLPAEAARITIQPDGSLRVPVRAPRPARYQVARFCRWEGEAGNEYRYRITPASLARARKQGLRAGQLVTLLRRYAAAPPAPALVQAIERWEDNGPQAQVEPLTVLRLATPEMLAALRRSRAARYLGDPLGPTAVAVKPGAVDKVRKALAEMGYLTDEKGEGAEGV